MKKNILSYNMVLISIIWLSLHFDIYFPLGSCGYLLFLLSNFSIVLLKFKRNVKVTVDSLYEKYYRKRTTQVSRTPRIDALGMGEQKYCHLYLGYIEIFVVLEMFRVK